MATADRTTGATSWTVGDRLRQARCFAGLTLHEMGEHLGVSNTVVSGYEQEAMPIPASVIITYAEVTGVGVGWLRTGTGKPSPFHSGRSG
jgi:transcriptional regulator with XRE-family HTH domain